MELSTWAPPDRLASWVTDSVDGLLRAVDDLVEDDPRWDVPYLPTINPPIWEIAHAAWFAEWFVLRRLHGRDPLIEGADARYDSAAVPHLTRWEIGYPSPAETRHYVRSVGDAVADVVRDDRGLDSTAWFALYATAHFDAHVEALTYTRQALGWTAPSGVEPLSAPGLASLGDAEVSGDRDVTGGRLLLGASRAQPFVLDNERWAHPVEVEPFSMSVAPVTMDEFEAFVDDGAYDHAECWSPEGWAWRQATSPGHPVYWRRTESGWEHRTFDTWTPVAEHARMPMMHVTWFEAEAWCRWAGRRLPTEAEWEFAATTDGSGAKRWWYPWGDRDPQPGDAALDGVGGGLVPVDAFPAGDGPWGHRQMMGNIWEWTASTFEPYPHFEPDAYRDNSEPWFGSRKVLRGGAWSTRSRYVRATFRNYFEPHRSDVYAGFRTCAQD